MISRGRELSYYTPEVQRSSYYVKEIRFYDKNGRVKNAIKIGEKGSEWIYISPQKKYVLVSRVPTEYNTGYCGGVLYDCNGNKVWEKKGPTLIAVSDEGYTVGTILDWQVPPEPGGSFYIYTPSGKLIKTIENPDKESSAPLFAKYSRDGEYALLVFKGTTVPPTIITLIKKTGEILWKRKFPECRFSGREEEIDILPEVGIAGIFDKYERNSSNKEVRKYYAFFIDWEGNLRWMVPLEIRGNMIVKISDDGRKVYVVTTEGYIWCIDIKSGVLLWEHRESWSPKPGSREPWPWEVPLFCELRVVRDTLYIIGKQGRDWHSSTFFMFDGRSGRLLKKVEYPQEKITFAKVKEKISLINTVKGKVCIFKKEVQK